MHLAAHQNFFLDINLSWFTQDIHWIYDDVRNIDTKNFSEDMFEWFNYPYY